MHRRNNALCKLTHLLPPSLAYPKSRDAIASKNFVRKLHTVQDFTLDMENVSISPKGFFALKLITLIGTTKKGPRECPGHPQ